MDYINDHPYITGEPDSHCHGCGKRMNHIFDSHPEDVAGEYCPECWEYEQMVRAEAQAQQEEEETD